MRQTLRELGGSILFAIVAILLVLAGISLALAEGFIPVASNPFPSPTSFQVQVFPTSSAQLIINTLPPEVPVDTNTPAPAICSPPAGWLTVQVGQGDTLDTLAIRYQTTAALLAQGNCLTTSDPLVPDTMLYVPPAAATATQTSHACGPPGGWVIYTVHPGDTMYSLSHAYGVSIAQLQAANCLASGQTSLRSGQQLWVPNVITRTPLASRTPTLTPVSIIFPTQTSSLTTGPPSTPSATATATGTATQPPTSTQPPTATQPPTPTATVTLFP